MHLTRQALRQRYQHIKKVHFVGITSPFSSFCATHLIQKGMTVSASELRQDTESAKTWIQAGVLYPGPHNADYITEDVDLVILPNGAIPGNPEVDKVLKKDIPYVLIQELLGFISTSYKTIAIAGTHGKTTTSALIVWMLHKTIGTPNFIVGDAKDKIGGDIQKNWNITKDSEYLVIEACEYRRQFLERAPHPFISVITHIDLDHTDYYTSQEDYNAAFTQFILPTQYALVIDSERRNEQVVITESTFDKKIITTKPIYTALPIHLPLPGEHNRQNVARALGVAEALKIPQEKALQAINTFPGITARFEKIGFTKIGTPVYWDYAHNPEKVTACLAGAREQFPKHTFIVVYQPHNHERTHTFKKQLAKAVHEADILFIPNIYSSRESEEDKKRISADEFVQYLQATYPEKTIFFTNDTNTEAYRSTAQKVLSHDTQKALIILISAGDLVKISSHIVAS